MEPDAMRKIGYFHNGFEGNFKWWEGPVKRMDVPRVLLVSPV